MAYAHQLKNKVKDCAKNELTVIGEQKGSED